MKQKTYGILVGGIVVLGLMCVATTAHAQFGNICPSSYYGGCYPLGKAKITGKLVDLNNGLATKVKCQGTADACADSPPLGTRRSFNMDASDSCPVEFRDLLAPTGHSIAGIELTKDGVVSKKECLIFLFDTTSFGAWIQKLDTKATPATAKSEKGTLNLFGTSHMFFGKYSGKKLY